jgi:hypothetical protein
MVTSVSPVLTLYLSAFPTVFAGVILIKVLFSAGESSLTVIFSLNGTGLILSIPCFGSTVIAA